MPVNHYDGSAFSSAVPKYYDGSSWTEVPVKYWDGSQWVTIHSVSGGGGGTTMIEDHESVSSVTDVYADQTSDFSIQTDGALGSGSNYLQSDGSFDELVYNSDVCSRGNEYACLVNLQANNFFYCAFDQNFDGVDSSTDGSAYVLKVNNGDEIEMMKYSAGGMDFKQSSSTFSFSTGTTYELAIIVEATGINDNITGEIRDGPDGNVIASASITDDEYTNGGISFNSGSNGGSHMDEIVERPI